MSLQLYPVSIYQFIHHYAALHIKYHFVSGSQTGISYLEDKVDLETDKGPKQKLYVG